MLAASFRTQPLQCTSKRPFGGPEAVLAHLSRYTHRVAISNSRLLASDGDGVTFKYRSDDTSF
jgi:hypothetical protein